MRGLILFLALLSGSIAASAAALLPHGDTMAQRTLACTSCHGREGRAGPDGYYPRIAGKPVGYLYNQLLHFRDARRHYGLMAGLLNTLSDAYLYEIAQHFAALDLPYPPPASARVPPEVLQRGRVLALQGDPRRDVPACASCHGEALTGIAPQVPGLLGLPRDYLNAQLGAWRTGGRRALAPDCMEEIARRLTPEDLSAVTAFLAAEPLPADPRPVAAAQAGGVQSAGGPDSSPMRCGFVPPPGGSAR